MRPSWFVGFAEGTARDRAGEVGRQGDDDLDSAGAGGGVLPWFGSVVLIDLIDRLTHINMASYALDVRSSYFKDP